MSVDGVIRRAVTEPECNERLIQFGIKHVWCFVKSVERLVKAQYLVLLLWDDKTGRLANVDILDELPNEERGIYIHVMHRPPLLGSKSKQESR
jgi:hypothetical protein